ncbi:MAG: response regulator, partial [Acidobacteriota bacterium]
MSRLRTLIVDDEPIARQHLRVYLEREPDIAIDGECRGGLEAVRMIRKRRPDLVFLDIQMPDLDGFGVLERLTSDEVPAVIFVTAFDEYAVRAFRVEALDYLLKPFDEARFRETLERARRRIDRAGLATLTQRLGNLVRQTSGRPRPLERLAVKKDGESVVVRTDSIDWIEAQANYVRL